jgi:UDP-N-acetylmuramoyl-tripeptide--D-alanyl-D-alanine ligase
VVKTIRESLTPLHEIFICEMGAKNIGDIKELCDIVHPTHGVITSIGPQHLDSFLSIENVLKTKFELADSLPEKGFLFLNGDNEFIQNYALHNNKYKNTIPYATTLISNGYTAHIKSVSRKGTVFEVVTPSGEKKEFNTKLIGSHNVINVLGAIAVANTLGITLEELLLPVRKLSPVEHRLQLIERNNITIIDDAYNSNPVGAQAALDTLAMFTETKILVTPGMIELGTKEDEYNYEFGTSAAKVCDYIILVGQKQTASIARGVLEAGYDNGKLYIADNLTDAMNHAYLIQSEERKIILLENDLPDNY